MLDWNDAEFYKFCRSDERKASAMWPLVPCLGQSMLIDVKQFYLWFFKYQMQYARTHSTMNEPINFALHLFWTNSAAMIQFQTQFLLISHWSSRMSLCDFCGRLLFFNFVLFKLFIHSQKCVWLVYRTAIESSARLATEAPHSFSI